MKSVQPLHILFASILGTGTEWLYATLCDLYVNINPITFVTCLSIYVLSLGYLAYSCDRLKTRSSYVTVALVAIVTMLVITACPLTPRRMFFFKASTIRVGTPFDQVVRTMEGYDIATDDGYLSYQMGYIPSLSPARIAHYKEGTFIFSPEPRTHDQCVIEIHNGKVVSQRVSVYID